jgi:transposase
MTDMCHRPRPGDGRKYWDSQRKIIRKLHRDGATTATIGKGYGVSGAWIRCLLSRWEKEGKR